MRETEGGNDWRKRWVLSLEWNWDVDRSRSRGAEPNWLVWEECMAGWRISFESAFQRTGARWVNDISVILSRVETEGCLRVTVEEERLHVFDSIWRRLCRLWGSARLECFEGGWDKCCSECVDQFWANVRIWKQVKHRWLSWELTEVDQVESEEGWGRESRIENNYMIQRRSRINIKQDFELCSDMVCEVSNMTLRLQAQSDGVIVALESTIRAASKTS